MNLTSDILDGLFLACAIIAVLICGYAIARYVLGKPKDKRSPEHEEDPNPLQCPNCGSMKFYEGPEAPGFMNVKCAQCGAVHNYMYPGIAGGGFFYELNIKPPTEEPWSSEYERTRG